MSAAARDAAPDETARKIVHALYGLVALSLRFLPPWGAVAVAGAFVMHNRWLLPRWGATLLRPGERWPWGGVHLYPLAVLVAVVVFLGRPELAACIWGVIAFGDGAAALVGRAVGGARLPWNPEKTWAGTTAFVVSGAIGGGALTAFVSVRSPEGAMTFAAACVPAALAAVSAAAVESLRTRWNDNATAPLAAIGALGIWVTADVTLFVERVPAIAGRALPAFAVSAVAATFAARAGVVTLSGAVAGLLLAAATWMLGGPRLYALFAACFVLAAAATRFGRDAKRALRVAEANEGRRGARQALANTGVPVALAALSVFAREPGPFLLAAAGGLATAAMDTASSEVGQVLGRRPVLIGTLRRVPIGTEGGVSLEGTAAGVLAALAVSGLGCAVGLFAPAWVGILTLAATAGGLLESAAARGLGPKGHLGNDAMNLLNTAAGSALCLAAGLVGGVQFD
ncbi:MAG: DUF92 domain-containing protein [Candidatus Eiseniibacteriota bacterium]